MINRKKNTCSCFKMWVIDFYAKVGVRTSKKDQNDRYVVVRRTLWVFFTISKRFYGLCLWARGLLNKSFR